MAHNDPLSSPKVKVARKQANDLLPGSGKDIPYSPLSPDDEPSSPGSAAVERARQQVDATLNELEAESEAPTIPHPLGDSLSGPEEAGAPAEEGWFTSFINDPKTVAGVLFALGTLNSESTNIAGSFLEGLGAVGSGLGSQNTLENQRAAEELAQTKMALEQRKAETEEFTASQAVKQAREGTKIETSKLSLDRYKAEIQNRGFDVQEVEVELRKRGLSLEKVKLSDARLAASAANTLGHETNRARLLAVLLEAQSRSSDRQAASADRDRQLQIELLRLAIPSDEYEAMTPAEREAKALSTLKVVANVFPFARKH